METDQAQEQHTATVETKKHNISIREMPVDLWRAFRMYCLDKGLTVEDEVINALNEYLVNHAPAIEKMKADYDRENVNAT